MDNVELQPLSPDQVVSLHVEASSGQEHQEHDVIETNDETNDVVDQPANSNQHQDETDDVVSGLLDQKGADLRNRLKAQIYGHARDGEMRRTAAGRWAAMMQGLQKNVSNFFGVGDDETTEKWKERVERMHATSKLVGSGYKQYDTPLSDQPHTASAFPMATPSLRPATYTPRIHDPFRIPVSRQASRLSVTSMGRRLQRAQVMTPQTGKDSVLRMAFDGFRTLVTTTGHKEQTSTVHSRSFVPHQITQTLEMSTPSIKLATPGATPGVLPTPGQLSALDAPSMARLRVPTPGADSVFQSDDFDEVFYDVPVPTSAAAVWSRGANAAPSLRFRGASQTRHDEAGGFHSTEQPPQDFAKLHPLSDYYIESTTSPLSAEIRPSKAGWQPGRSQPEPGPSDTPGPGLPAAVARKSFEGMSRISDVVLEDFLDDNGKRQIGKGIASFLTAADYRFSRIDPNIRQQMIALDDHRPYFTYWVTIVQIICYIVSVAVYGISTIGFSYSIIESEVLKSNLAIEKAHYLEDNNMWIGPRQADLIHLGAKYSPCMRRDENVERAIEKDQEHERGTACCIRNDRSGCVQASRTNCSATLATWKKWNVSSSQRTSGTVCGLDYRFCQNPPGDIEDLWPDDITKWPACQSPVPVHGGTQNDEHMVCKIQGRPCCIGIQGECIITTREHCTFLRGYFHQENTLCSQVSCMNEICGMMPFANPSYPDQFYRLFISLFIHVGLLQLLITVAFQYIVMRDLEKLAGSLRIGIIYIASGIAGSLSSAIFLPYHVEAGPAGSQFGLLACLFVEVIQNWYILRSPLLALLRLGLIVLVLFVVGLLPMVDNYAHLVGFFFGFLLAFALLPYITFNVCDKRGKLVGIIVCLVGASGLLVGLFMLFYVAPLYNCPNCHYFNCLPITKDFCRSMMVEIGRFPWYS